MSEQFKRDVRAWGKRAFEQDPSLDFDGLVRALPGVHPDDVERILGIRQKRSGHEASREGLSSSMESLCGLPAPHPLDYDWRFSADTVAELTRRAEVLTPPGGSIALLGAPSLFRALRKQRPDAKLILADISARSIEALSSEFQSERFIVCDLLCGATPGIHADVVVADPPWYPEHFEAFMRSAAQIVSVGGYLLLCGPNHGTRPGVTAEWAKIEEYSRSLGFGVGRVKDVVRYDTPPFERNALKAAGHSRLSSDWRTGLVGLFTRERILPGERWAPESGASEWDEHAVGGVRWRVRVRARQNRVSPTLHELVPGDVLDSVSRRDVRRASVDLWSSGNRVLGCTDTYAASLILLALGTGASPVTYIERAFGRQLESVERDAVQASERRLKDIIEIEQAEYLRSLEILSVS